MPGYEFAAESLEKALNLSLSEHRAQLEQELKSTDEEVGRLLSDRKGAFLRVADYLAQQRDCLLAEQVGGRTRDVDGDWKEVVDLYKVAEGRAESALIRMSMECTSRMRVALKRRKARLGALIDEQIDGLEAWEDRKCAWDKWAITCPLPSEEPKWTQESKDSTTRVRKLLHQR
jgi:hypothetical protein